MIRGAYGLTANMASALLVIQEIVDAKGRAPSYEQLGIELDLASKSAVHKIVNSLVERRYLFRAADGLRILRRLPIPEEAAFVGLFDAPELIAAEPLAS